MNKVFLVGRLTRDNDFRMTAGNLAVLRNSLAVDRRVRRIEGADNTNNADFINIVAFGQLAETMNKYLSKGRQIAIDGRIQTGSYQKDGQTVYTTDVVVENCDFCGSKGDTGEFNNNQETNYTSTNNQSSIEDPFSSFGQEVKIDTSDDELPF